VRVDAAAGTPRLYALDCGHAQFSDMRIFSDTGEYDGKPGELAVPCFLIRHPKGDLLWDTGLGDHFAARKQGSDPAPGVHMSVATPLLEQLRALQIEPRDIAYLAFSHLHWDHTGNANAFGSATWLMNRSELAAASAMPAPDGVLPETFSAVKSVQVEFIDGDRDVFGDGSVVILRAPGHTPGHQVLSLRLARAGTVILSGDLYHLRASRSFRRVPVENVSRADTLASMIRIETIVKNTHGRLIVQHDPEDFRALPKPPAYLD
jgi:glyoxylase-like metal-dependent hydrolase (beta-lactamase superfamily II)